MSFATFFEWEIREGRDAAFSTAWEAATRHLLELGSNGSALFRTDGGNFAAFARWPSRAARDYGFTAAEFPPEALRMADEVLRTVHRVDLEGVSDLWTLR